MSSPTPDSNAVEHKPQKAEDHLNDALNTVESIINCINFQVLGNADGLHENVTDPAEKAALKTLVESMIKKPFRRQVGRLKQVNRLIREAQSKLE